MCAPHKALACSGLCCRDCDMVSDSGHKLRFFKSLCKVFFVLWCQMSWSWDQDAHKLSGCTGVQTIDVYNFIFESCTCVLDWMMLICSLLCIEINTIFNGSICMCIFFFCLIIFFKITFLFLNKGGSCEREREREREKKKICTWAVARHPATHSHCRN